MEAFFTDAFFLSKCVILFLTWYMDTRVFVYYLIIFLAFFVIIPTPMFTGPSKMEYFTPGSFFELIEDRGDSGEVCWLVVFFTPWHPACLSIEPTIASLSLQYTSDKLKFGKIDVGRWPALAEKYTIDTGALSKQLPTLIMFEKGKEAGRIPHLYPDGKVATGTFRRSDIVTAFALNERWDGGAQSQAVSKSKPATESRGGMKKKVRRAD